MPNYICVYSVLEDTGPFVQGWTLVWHMTAHGASITALRDRDDPESVAKVFSPLAIPYIFEGIGQGRVTLIALTDDVAKMSTTLIFDASERDGPHGMD